MSSDRLQINGPLPMPTPPPPPSVPVMPDDAVLAEALAWTYPTDVEFLASHADHHAALTAQMQAAGVELETMNTANALALGNALLG